MPKVTFVLPSSPPFQSALEECHRKKNRRPVTLGGVDYAAGTVTLDLHQGQIVKDGDQFIHRGFLSLTVLTEGSPAALELEDSDGFTVIHTILGDSPEAVDETEDDEDETEDETEDEDDETEE
jgi:hypothetical protein